MLSMDIINSNWLFLTNHYSIDYCSGPLHTHVAIIITYVHTYIHIYIHTYFRTASSIFTIVGISFCRSGLAVLVRFLSMVVIFISLWGSISRNKHTVQLITSLMRLMSKSLWTWAWSAVSSMVLHCDTSGVAHLLLPMHILVANPVCNHVLIDLHTRYVLRNCIFTFCFTTTWTFLCSSFTSHGCWPCDVPGSILFHRAVYKKLKIQ